jgi:hypothetical protein
LYKNFITGNYVLHRLYKNGKRYDLEEKYDLAKKEPNVVKVLSKKLENYLKDYDADLPYKEPSRFKNESDVAFIPVITNDYFDAETRKVSIQLNKGKSKVFESYALVKIADKAKKTKKGNKKTKKKVKKKKVKSTYIKVPVEASSNRLNYTFTVPKEAQEFGIILIDENRFMVKGKFHKLTSSETPKKEKRRKKVKKKQ